MMRTSLLGLLAVLPLAALPHSTAARAVQAPDLAALVREEAGKLGEGAGEDLWRQVRAIADLSRKLEGQDLAAAADGLLADPTKLAGGAKLFAVALRLQAQDPDVDKLSALLVQSLGSSNAQISLGAAQLAADPYFKTLDVEPREQLTSMLSRLSEDGALAPEFRLECAASLHTLGGGEDKRNAWRLMNGFLASKDPELRQLGALTLARTRAEISGPLRDELRRLAALPGVRGRLADSYLEASRIEEYSNTKLRRQAELLEAQREQTAPKGEVTPAQVFTTVLNVVQRGHLEGDKVKEQELLEAALNGMLHSLDEHSAYMSPEVFTKFEQDLEAGYGGIGAYVQTDPDDELFTITHPIYSGPAYKAQLRSDDKIVRVDDWPTIGKSSEEVIKRLKGRPGTKVKLYIWRRGMETAKIDRPTEDMAVEIERAAIQIPAVQSQMLPGKVGLISMVEFSRVAADELREALAALQRDGMQSLILDLRSNPGGLLDEAVEVAAEFLPKGSLVVSTESRVERGEKHYTESSADLPADVPMAVLVNRFSASASEIVSGALQDHQRATVVGLRSFGKGSVQRLIPLPGMQNDQFADENGNGRHENWEPITRDWNGNGVFDFAPHLKLTVARYLLPSGRSIHRELDGDGNIISSGGVDPDLKVEARQFDAWRVAEMLRVQNTRKIRDYVDRELPKNEALFVELAENDRRDPARYPGFDDLMAGLGTPLSADEVRQLVRVEVRRRVQDLRGKEFPGGDFVEDTQLQAAIRVVLEKRGLSTADFEEYKAAIPPADHGPIQLAKVERRSVQETLEQVSAARKADGKLSPELLDRLEELLQASLKERDNE